MGVSLTWSIGWSVRWLIGVMVVLALVAVCHQIFDSSVLVLFPRALEQHRHQLHGSPACCLEVSACSCPLVPPG